MKKQIKHRSELHLLLNDPKTAKIAEVGVAEGRFSLEILNWGIDHLYLVDIWETKNFFGDAASPQSWHDSNYNEAKERVSNFSNKVTFLKGLSSNMAKDIEEDSLDMVYLDACHTYEAVLEDLEVYLPKLKKGGIMAGHDFLNPTYGVNKAVYEFAEKNNYEINTIPEHSPENASFWFVK
jgi:hypothetical protein